MSFETLQDQAQVEWTEFERPDQARILVGSATCGRAAGSLEVLQAFVTELDKHGLSITTKTFEVGCLGMCYAEVLVEIRSQDGLRVLYHGVEPRHVPALVESQLINGAPQVGLAVEIGRAHV